MKQSMKTIALCILLVASVSIFNSCRRTINTEHGSDVYDNSTTAMCTISGLIKDESGAPIANATVSAGGATQLTNAQGIFILHHITTPVKATTLKISKTGYFNGYKTLSIQEGAKHTIYQTLLKKENPQSLDALVGGTVSSGNGINITFPINALVSKSTGQVYNGNAIVYIKKIDPTTLVGKASMPGDLRGLNANGLEKILWSFGMMTAEIEDINGNALQLAPNKEATLSVQIPTSLIGQANNSIPLWYFDDIKNMWVEEGSANLQGTSYVGQVKHFSFWNCDIASSSIHLDMTLVDQNGVALNGYQVELVNTANNQTSSGLANSNGWVGGMVYPSATLTMNIYATGLCTSPIYTTTITTGVTNMSLGILTLNLASTTASTVDGTVLGCNNLPSANALVLIQPSNTIIYPNASGYFIYTLPCTPSFPLTFTAYDISNGIFGSSSTMTLVTGTNTIGNLYACGNITPYLNIVVTNTTTGSTISKNFTAPINTLTCRATLSGTTSLVFASDSNNGGMHNVAIQIPDTIITNQILVTAPYITGFANVTDNTLILNAGSNFMYTVFPLVPFNASGTFSINATGSITGDNITLTGSFLIPRTQ